jgi:hypothetical protein
VKIRADDAASHVSGQNGISEAMSQPVAAKLANLMSMRFGTDLRTDLTFHNNNNNNLPFDFSFLRGVDVCPPSLGISIYSSVAKIHQSSSTQMQLTKLSGLDHRWLYLTSLCCARWH